MSISFQADADLNQEIVNATRRREPAIEFFSAAEANLAGMLDAQVLEIAASR